jgi:hypothetical protein
MANHWTPEERAAHGARIKAAWAAKSPESRAAHRAACSAGHKALAAARAALDGASASDPQPAGATPLGQAVRDEAERLGSRLADLTAAARSGVVPGGDGCSMPARPAWLPRHGAPADAHRTNGDIGRTVAHLLDAVVDRVVEGIVPRLQGALRPQRQPSDALRPRLVALARLTAAMAHSDCKAAGWLDAVARVSQAAIDLESALAREAGR